MTVVCLQKEGGRILGEPLTNILAAISSEPSDITLSSSSLCTHLRKRLSTMWRRLRCCSTHSSCKAWPELKDEKVPTAWPETGKGKWAPKSIWCPCPRQRPFESLASLSWWSCNPGRTAQRHCRTSWQRRPWRSLRICLDRMKFNRDILMVWAWSLFQFIKRLAP